MRRWWRRERHIMPADAPATLAGPGGRLVVPADVDLLAELMLLFRERDERVAQAKREKEATRC